MLEQEAHILGFRDSVFPAGDIASPQQIQIVGFNRVRKLIPVIAGFKKNLSAKMGGGYFDALNGF
jgi:hypothetical protein